MNPEAARLKFICRLGYGDALPKEEDSAGDVPVFGSNGQYATTAIRNTDVPAIVLGRKGSYGKVNWAPSGCFASDTTFFIDIRLTNSNLRWLYWALQTLRLDEGSQEAAVPGLNRESVYEQRVVLPEPELQRLIADYLDRETARIDALVEEKERMLALLEEKRAALISRAVTRGLDPNVSLKPSGLDWLGDIPAHWDVCQLKRTWTSSDYGLSESIRDEGDVSVLRMSCIVDGRIDATKAGTIEEADEYLFLRRGDLLFNRTNSLDQIAKVGLVDFEPDSPLTFASYLVRIRVNHRALSEYLVYLLNSREFLDYARKNAIPAIGQANLSPTRYGEIHIPLPDIAEQESIVRLLDGESELSIPLRRDIQDSVDLLKERRAALITAAVTGQIPTKEMTA